MKKTYQVLLGLVAFVVIIELYIHVWPYFSKKGLKVDAPAYIRSVVHKCDEKGAKPPPDLVPGVKFILYIISHDDKSYDVATRYCKCKPWTKVLPIPTTPYFESVIYDNLLMNRKEEWQGMDFVGISTYRSLKFAPLDKLKLLLELAHHRPYDVMPLYTTGEYMLPQAVGGHTIEFTYMWDTLLKAQGYNELEIRSQDHSEVFLRNSVIIRPQWLERLSHHMSQAMNIVKNNTIINAAFMTDAHYRESKFRKKVAQRVFQTNYYQWHPFVFERLPVFYLHHYNASVYGTLRETEWFDFRDSSALFKGL